MKFSIKLEHDFSVIVLQHHDYCRAEAIHAANTRHWPNVVLMLARRLRRRPNVKTPSVQHLVFAGTQLFEEDETQRKSSPDNVREHP